MYMYYVVEFHSKCYKKVLACSISSDPLASATKRIVDFDPSSSAMANKSEAFTPVTLTLGNLPETPGGPQPYPVPVTIPTSAESLLLYAFATTTNEASFQRGYFEIYTKEANDVQYKMYMNFATGTSSAVTVTSANVWLPITSERKVYVNLIYPEDVCIAHKEKAPGRKKLQGMACDALEEWSNLFITGWK